MTKPGKSILLTIAGLVAALIIWWVPKGLSTLTFMESEFSATDWGLILFAVTLAVAFLGICIHTLYRERVPKVMALVGWFIPISFFVFYTRSLGTYRGVLMAILLMALIMAGNGLGRAFTTPLRNPTSWLFIAGWIVLGFGTGQLFGRLMTEDGPLFLEIGIGLLIMAGAFIYFRGANRLIRGGMIALSLAYCVVFSLLLWAFGLRLEDSLAGFSTPILVLGYSFAEARWTSQ